MKNWLKKYVQNTQVFLRVLIFINFLSKVFIKIARLLTSILYTSLTISLTSSKLLINIINKDKIDNKRNNKNKTMNLSIFFALK